MKNQEKLPNFLIVGVPKAGTTSLYNYMVNSGQIYFPSIKEPHFFISKCVKNKVPICVDSWSEYVKLFSDAGNQKFLGEASVFYFYYNEFAINEIKKYLGDNVYIILILRNPVERAYSAYKYTLALNKDENLTFSQAIDEEESRIAENKVSPMLFYVSGGMYAERLEQWKNNFVNLKVVFFDDLVADPQNMVDDIFAFLDIDEVSQVDFSKKYNAGFGSEWKNPLFGKFIKGATGRSLRDISHKLFPGGYHFIKNAFLKNAMINTSIPSEEKLRLIEIYSDDVRKTSILTGRDLSFWLQN